MANKPRIGQYEQRTMLNAQPLNAPIKPMVNNALQEIANTGKELGDILARQSERIDALKLRNNEEKLSIKAAEMNNALAQANTPEDFDNIVKDYTTQMKDQSKEFLGKRLYGLWQPEEENYMKALDVDIAGKKIALNKKLALDSGKDTVKNMAYQYAYGNDGERRTQDYNFNEFINNPDNNFNELEKKTLRQTYDHDKEFGYLTQEVSLHPEQVKKQLEDKNNFSNLSVKERETFKQTADSMIKTLDTLKQKQWDEAAISQFAPLKQKALEKIYLMQQDIKDTVGDIKKADNNDIPLDKVISLYQYINELSTKPVEDLKGPHGEKTYLLDTSSGEQMPYIKDLMPYMQKGIRGVLENDYQKGKTVFGTQIGLIAKAVKQDPTLNEFDVMSMIQEVMNANNATFTGRENEIFDDITTGNNADTHNAFKEGIDNFYLKTGRTKAENVNTASLPKDMRVSTIDG
ncbi:MAG: hypothetical protein J5601_02745, partial [Elusimicrobiaceae bacterium]|nr:hypothetical protein [Elusimicrobiaceae bacterium]